MFACPEGIFQRPQLLLGCRWYCTW